MPSITGLGISLVADVSLAAGWLFSAGREIPTPGLGGDDGVQAPSSGTPFSSCVPRSSKAIPEPATRSLTVCDTSTSPVAARAETRAPIETAIPATLPSRTSHSPAPGRCAAPGRVRAPLHGWQEHSRSRGLALESREEPVPGRVDLHAAEPGQLPPNPRMMLSQQLSPPHVPEFGRPGSRANDVPEQDSRQHLVRLGGFACGRLLEEGNHVRQQLRRKGSCRNVLLAVQFHVRRPGDVPGEIAPVLNPDPRVSVLMHTRVGVR